MTQNQALEILKSGKNVYLTGAAGSGKTHLLNEYVRYLKDKKIEVGITASTGIAATHMGGLTIHSFAGIGIKRRADNQEIKKMAGNRRVLKRMRKIKVLVIDEISMLDADRLDLIDRVVRFTRASMLPFGGLQVILSGDFFQLPPIPKENEPPPKFAFHANAWNALNLKICYLTEAYRQNDSNFLKVLMAIREANISENVLSRLNERVIREISNKENITKLYCHNDDVDSENLRKLDLLPGKEFKYAMRSRGVKKAVESLKKSCLAPETLTLKKGAAVMFVKNNFERGYVNGTLGTVKNFEGGLPVILTRQGREIVADLASWSAEDGERTLAEIIQIPLRLAWAITIHKSQGMTLDEAQINLADAFEKGMGYVALSRVRALQNLHLLGFNEIALQVHPEILEFDRELKTLSETAQKEFATA